MNIKKARDCLVATVLKVIHHESVNIRDTMGRYKVENFIPSSGADGMLFPFSYEV